MLFFILGVRTTKIKAKPLKGKTVCVKCNSVESFKLGGTANYFHLFWIPLIPLGKFEEFICTKCGKHHYKKTAPKDLLSNLENQPLKRPKWHFLGIGLIFIWFLSGSVFALIFNVKYSISNNERHKVLEAEKALFVKDLSQAKFSPSFETDSIAFQINNNLDFKKYGVNNSNIAYKTQIRGNKLLVILNIKGGKKLKYENLLPLHKSIEDFVIITYKGKLIKPYVVFYDEDKLLYVDTSKMNHYFESDGNPVMDFYDDNDIVDIERRKELEYKTQLLHAYRENRISSVKMDTAKVSK